MLPGVLITSRDYNTVLLQGVVQQTTSMQLDGAWLGACNKVKFQLSFLCLCEMWFATDANTVDPCQFTCTLLGQLCSSDSWVLALVGNAAPTHEVGYL